MSKKESKYYLEMDIKVEDLSCGLDEFINKIEEKNSRYEDDYIFYDVTNDNEQKPDFVTIKMMWKHRHRDMGYFNIIAEYVTKYLEIRVN